MINSTPRVLAFIAKSVYCKFAKNTSDKTFTCIGYSDAIMKCTVKDVWEFAKSNDMVIRDEDFDYEEIIAIEQTWAKLMVKDVSHYYNVESAHFLAN